MLSRLLLCIPMFCILVAGCGENTTINLSNQSSTEISTLPLPTIVLNTKAVEVTNTVTISSNRAVEVDLVTKIPIDNQAGGSLLEKPALQGPLILVLQPNGEYAPAILDIGTNNLYSDATELGEPLDWINNGCSLLLRARRFNGTEQTVFTVDLTTNSKQNLLTMKGDQLGKVLFNDQNSSLVISHQRPSEESLYQSISLKLRDEAELISIATIEKGEFKLLGFNHLKDAIFYTHQEEMNTSLMKAELISPFTHREIVDLNRIMPISTQQGLSINVAEIANYEKFGTFARLIAYEEGPLGDKVIHQMGVLHLESMNYVEIFDGVEAGQSYIGEGVSWSPHAPVFVIGGFYPREIFNKYDLVIVDARTVAHKFLQLDTLTEQYPWLLTAYEPEWSPNGEYIIFQSGQQVGLYNLEQGFVEPIDGMRGGGVHANTQSFRWSPAYNQFPERCAASE